MEYVNITKSTVKCHDIYLHQRVKLRMGAHSSIHKKLIPRNVWIDISWKYPSLRVYPTQIQTNVSTGQSIYRVSRGECARLRENVPYIKVHRSNPKHLYPKLNGYRDNGQRKVWSSCGSTYCTCFACCYPYTAHVRPSFSQPSQAHSAFIINRCHSYSEL